MADRSVVPAPCDARDEEIASLSREILDRYEETTLVYRMCERLGEAIDERAIAREVLDGTVSVLGASAAEFWLHQGAAVARIASHPADAPGTPLGVEVAQAVLADSRAVLRDSDAGASALGVPLVDGRDGSLGAIVLIGDRERAPYGSVQAKLVGAIATLASAFIRNHRLVDRAREADRRERDVAIAGQVHRGLLPDTDPHPRGLDVAGSCRAAERVGGDFFGYVDAPDGAFTLALADVSGHGVGAAMCMAAAKGAIQAEARRGGSPGDLLRRVNDALVEDYDRSEVFATAFVATFSPDRSRATFSNGGHNAPLLLRGDGRCQRLERGGLALGIMPHVLYQEESHALGRGDALVVYTDGVVEARNVDRETYGVDRLRRIASSAASGTARGVLDAVRGDLDAFRRGTPLRDDATLVIVRVGESAGELR